MGAHPSLCLRGIGNLVRRSVRTLRELPGDLSNAGEPLLWRIARRPGSAPAGHVTIRIGQAPALRFARGTEATRELLRIIIGTRPAITRCRHAP